MRDHFGRSFWFFSFFFAQARSFWRSFCFSIFFRPAAIILPTILVDHFFKTNGEYLSTRAFRNSKHNPKLEITSTLSELEQVRYCGLEHANEQCWSHGSPMLAANTLLITIITTESAQKLQTQLKTQTKWSRLGEKNWKNKMIAKMIAPERKKNEKTKMIAQNDRAPKWSRIIFSRLCLANPSIMIDHFGGDCLYSSVWN